MTKVHTEDRSATAPARATVAGVRIAFFSMEIATDDTVPTYSGGLGVLAGDFLRSAADLALPVAGVTLLYRDGYFTQHLDPAGHQTESRVQWTPEDVLEPLRERISLWLGGHTVIARAWLKRIHGRAGAQVPVYLLDTDVPENDPADRAITDQLYGGGQEHRLRQEAVLGLGGLAMLQALGHEPVTFHMNEGHCALLTLGLLESSLLAGDPPLWTERGDAAGKTAAGKESAGNEAAGMEVAGKTVEPGVEDEFDRNIEKDVASVRDRCVFTTHTPVAAGHDRFPAELVRSVLDAERSQLLARIGCLPDGSLNMTSLALRLSGYANAVSLRHGQVSREMFPGAAIRSITNGVHAASWAAPPFQELFDRELPGWRAENDVLRYATGIDLDDIDRAHYECKGRLIDAVRGSTGVVLDRDALVIGLARRSTPYKRTTLLFSDPERLRAIADSAGPLQVVCSGKAHPRDEAGKELISQIVAAGRALDGAVQVVFLEGYDMALARLLCAGSDIWLNTPEKPHEASGTSGMKAALNGVPSLSVLDGWWVEGCVEGVTGWAVGDESAQHDDAADLYEKLEGVVVPLYYRDPRAFLTVRRHAIALNGSFFHTERMAREYAMRAYRLTSPTPVP